jgi:hypothetical protein
LNIAGRRSMSVRYLSLTELGKLYGVSSHQVGKWLKGLGLRTEGNDPSELAFEGGFVDRRPSTQPGTYYYVWHEQKTTEILDKMGYPRAKQQEQD